MSTVVAVPLSAVPEKTPRGQGLLAAKIALWLALTESLAPEVDQLSPHLRDLFTQLQPLLANAQALYERFAILQEETAAALAHRDTLVSAGTELFSRLRLGLQAAYGPESPRLREFGLKPRGKRGRKKKVAVEPLVAEA